jgi:hypothetical protein
MAEYRLKMADDSYRKAQQSIETVCRLLFDPRCLGEPVLDMFIERAEEAQALGPILYPSEFRAGADKLSEVLDHARALREAAAKIKNTTARLLGTELDAWKATEHPSTQEGER